MGPLKDHCKDLDFILEKWEAIRGFGRGEHYDLNFMETTDHPRVILRRESVINCIGKRGRK